MSCATPKTATKQRAVLLSSSVTLATVLCASNAIAYDNMDRPFYAGGVWPEPNMPAAQQFFLGDNNTVNSTDIYLHKFGSRADGSIHLEIWDDSGSGTPAEPVGSLGSIMADDVRAGNAQYTFDQSVSGLTPNEPYYLVFSMDGTNWNGNNNIQWVTANNNNRGTNGASEGIAYSPSIRDWHTVRDFPESGGGPPFPVWFYAKVVMSMESLSPGDFDDDGLLTTADIDALTAAIIDPSDVTRFDLNADGTADSADHAYWVKELKNTWFGDANLDGEFNSEDMVAVFQAGKYELDLDAGWAEGDWSVDRRFSSEDLVAAFRDGGYARGPRAAVSAVPEPSCAILLGIGMIGLCCLRKHRKER